MRSSLAAVAGVGPSVVRADRASSGRHEPTEMRADRTLSAERIAEAVDYDVALSNENVSNARIAEGYLGLTESNVRRMRAGAYPLALAVLVLGPVAVFRSVLVRAVLRAMGRPGAIRFFAECLADVTKDGER